MWSTWIKFVRHYQEERRFAAPLLSTPRNKAHSPSSLRLLIQLLPSTPHPFRNQDTDKTSNSSDPTLQILYGQPWKHGHVNTEKKQNPTHGRSLEEEKHLQAMHWKNPLLRKKVKQEHVKDAGKCMSLDMGWTGESFSNLGPRHLEPHWQSGVIVPYFSLPSLGSTIRGHLLMQD